MARGPVKPFEFMLPKLNEQPQAPQEQLASANPGEQAYEAYGLAGTQNTLSEV